ncbi:MAG: HlyD family efflux transporter periplasmic adaptor subunit [Clostridium sp.]|jgi:multidrug resistance efflux pump|nr:HlyD family efflux transporter periplasmic adaptor subunit [Clostridium sp.]
MNESGRKKREWVKNAAIIFLSALVLLTFFSNTILNYSLPEVAVQYIQSGTITAKIRGTGIIESGDPYNVQIQETRTVESVLVKAGDTVQRGDPLFLLADRESDEVKQKEDEIKAKEQEIDAAFLAFELAVLSGTISGGVFQNVQNGNISTIAQYQSRIVASEAEIEKWQKEVDWTNGRISEISMTIEKLGYSSGSVDTTQETLAYNNAKAAYDAKYEELERTRSFLAQDQKALEEKKRELEKYDANRPTVSAGDKEAYDPERQALLNEINQLENSIRNGQSGIQTLQPQVNDLQIQRDKAQAALAAKEGNKGNINALNTELANHRQELTGREAKLKAAQDARQQLLTDIAQELTLDSQYKGITQLQADRVRLQEELGELRARASGASVDAPIAGTISAVHITAGQAAVPDTPIATMQPEGKGFTVSFSVTNQQASRLTVGAQADLVNSWRYEDVSVTLTGIKPDTSDPGQKKLLTFHVTGDVVAGQSLSLSVGDKSAQYEMIVPNSAVREDSNGKFLLIVESKSSPLGNRYIASRVDVEVVASDDTQSAVTGGLYGSEYVITTATKPVEAGKQVRLTEN